ncbi:post-GPI attachment to proteins factor 3-like [Oscarella lobularis]|uniref:post-GPI attachment to proteins factor 3-like n=1 Tax=Oscarella lobularis TaxID=121494 RepID=UPI00331338CC
MHQVTNDDIRYGRPVRQFYGKWPFVRIFGVQEVASTIFSVANCLAHVSALRRYRSRVPRRYRLYWVWQANSLVSIHAWVWSTVFHARDVPFTERMDYFAATSLIVMQVFCQQMRIVGGSRPARNAVSWLLGAIDASVYASYVYYMAFIRFDYGFNINFNVTLGVLMMCTWFGWCFVCKDKQPYVWKCVLFLLLLFSAMGLELGDFPPVFGLFDAHSLWHLATIPLPLLWYSFVVDDARYELKEQSVVLGRL